MDALIKPLYYTSLHDTAPPLVAAAAIGVDATNGGDVAVEAATRSSLERLPSLKRTQEDAALTQATSTSTDATTDDIDTPLSNKREKKYEHNDHSSHRRHSQCCHHRPRRIRFDDALYKDGAHIVGHVPHRCDYSVEERNELYWSNAELKQIRDTAKQIAKFYRCSQYSYCQKALYELDHVYATSLTAQPMSDAEDEQQGEDEEADVAHMDDDERSTEWQQFLFNDTNQMDRLAVPLVLYWCGDSGHRHRSRSSMLMAQSSQTPPLGRGLERYCSLRQRTERSHYTWKCRRAVIQEYHDQLQQQQLTPTTSNSTDTEPKDDAVAAVCRRFSRSSVLFARIMGHADELAAEEAVMAMATSTTTHNAEVPTPSPQSLLREPQQSALPPSPQPRPQRHEPIAASYHQQQQQHHMYQQQCQHHHMYQHQQQHQQQQHVYYQQYQQQAASSRYLFSPQAHCQHHLPLRTSPQPPLNTSIATLVSSPLATSSLLALSRLAATTTSPPFSQSKLSQSPSPDKVSPLLDRRKLLPLLSPSSARLLVERCTAATAASATKRIVVAHAS